MIEVQQDILSDDLRVDEEVEGYIHQVSVLARYIAVIGMLFSVGSTAKSLYGTIQVMLRYKSPVFGSFFWSIAASLIGGGVYFAISFFTYRFALKLKEALKDKNQDAFRKAWYHFKMCFRFIGVMFILYIALMLLIFLF